MGRTLLINNLPCTDQWSDPLNSAATWRYALPHRIVKIVYIRRRNDEDDRQFDREQWRDKSLVYLDEEGSIYRFYGNQWHVEPIRTMFFSCMDVRSWGDNYHFLFLHWMDKPLQFTPGIYSMSSQTQSHIQGNIQGTESYQRAWPAIYSTFEQSRPAKNPLMPPLYDYVARVDSNADIEVR